jgi:NTE family protein
MTRSSPSHIGLALGGGGVRGLAHVPAYETLQDLGLHADALSGTSMGAIMGAMFASGMSGRDARDFVVANFIPQGSGFRKLTSGPGLLLKFLRSIRLSGTRTAFFNADRFLEWLLDQLDVTTFEDLTIPLSVVATDFHSGEAVVFDSGPLFPALKASMAIPGVFVPLEWKGRVLVDGGLSHNLPYPQLPDDCDTLIAVDVSPTRETVEGEVPHLLDATLGMFDLLVENQTRTLLNSQPPTIYFRPKLTGVDVLEFDKINEILRQGDAETARFRGELSSLGATV